MFFFSHQCAHRHRARPPGQRLGRQPQPRDGGNAGRLGRHRRLAAAQRAHQCGGRRDVGEHPPRRRRGHRLQHPCRPGHRGRRHAGGGAPSGARADQRPRHGGGASRRRRLSGGDRLRQAAGRQDTDAESVVPDKRGPTAVERHGGSQGKISAAGVARRALSATRHAVAPGVGVGGVGVGVGASIWLPTSTPSFGPTDILRYAPAFTSVFTFMAIRSPSAHWRHSAATSIDDCITRVC